MSDITIVEYIVIKLVAITFKIVTEHHLYVVYNRLLLNMFIKAC